jgi:hypothetical protein
MKFDKSPHEQSAAEQELTPKEQLACQEAISDLKRPLLSLIEQLGSKLEAGEYDTLLVDDGSARMPAWIMKKVSDELRKGDNHGQIKAQYIAMGQDNTENKGEIVKESLIERAMDKGGKVLIVTEYIETGNSLTILCSALNDLGIAYDIATCGIDPEYDGRLEALGGHLYIGESSGKLPSVYGDAKINGVLNTKDGSALSKKYGSGMSRVYARELATDLAKGIARQYKSTQ